MYWSKTIPIYILITPIVAINAPIIRQGYAKERSVTIRTGAWIESNSIRLHEIAIEKSAVVGWEA